MSPPAVEQVPRSGMASHLARPRARLMSMWALAESLIQFDRGAEAILLIDECVAKAAGQAVDPGQIPGVMALRMGHFQKVGDPRRLPGDGRDVGEA
jgi:hypothetical protein